MVDDGIERYIGCQAVAAGIGLAVHHHYRLTRLVSQFIDGFEVDFEQIDHRLVFGPADETVTSEASRLAKTGFDQMGQPEHATEAVRVGMNMGNEGDQLGLYQAIEKAVGTAGEDGFA